MVTEISREELKQKLDHPKRFVLLEALSPESYHQAHLPGALNMPTDQVAALAPELIPAKDVEVIVYCTGPPCHASQRVTQELAIMGYAKVRHYAGGKSDWMEAGFRVMSNNERQAA